MLIAAGKHRELNDSPNQLPEVRGQPQQLTPEEQYLVNRVQTMVS